MPKMEKWEWEAATTCIGSTMMLSQAPGVTDADRRLGLGLAGFSQRLPDEVWNAAADMSEGMLNRTDDETRALSDDRTLQSD